MEKDSSDTDREEPSKEEWDSNKPMIREISEKSRRPSSGYDWGDVSGTCGGGGGGGHR